MEEPRDSLKGLFFLLLFGWKLRRTAMQRIEGIDGRAMKAEAAMGLMRCAVRPRAARGLSHISISAPSFSSSPSSSSLTRRRHSLLILRFQIRCDSESTEDAIDCASETDTRNMSQPNLTRPAGNVGPPMVSTRSMPIFVPLGAVPARHDSPCSG